jgi:hypothetical protein
MTDDLTTPLAAPPPPGWSNAPPNDGISSTEPPPEEIDMSEPGWSNNEPPAPPATGATAGTPGTWTPAGAAPCPAFTQMDTITATPATAWATGESVILGDASEAHWNGTTWQSGKA